MTKTTKLLFLITCITMISCNFRKNDLENSVWKECGDYHIVDVLDFRNSKYFNIKSDSIYMRNDSLIGIIDKIENHYGERRLYVRNLNGNIGRFCEQ